MADPVVYSFDFSGPLGSVDPASLPDWFTPSDSAFGNESHPIEYVNSPAGVPESMGDTSMRASALASNSGSRILGNAFFDVDDDKDYIIDIRIVWSGSQQPYLSSSSSTLLAGFGGYCGKSADSWPITSWSVPGSPTYYKADDQWRISVTNALPGKEQAFPDWPTDDNDALLASIQNNIIQYSFSQNTLTGEVKVGQHFVGADGSLTPIGSGDGYTVVEGLHNAPVLDFSRWAITYKNVNTDPLYFHFFEASFEDVTPGSEPCEPIDKHHETTPNVCLPFPKGTAPIDIAGDIQKLAEAADKALEGKFFPPDCPDPDPADGWWQYPPDLDGVDGHVVVSTVPLTWDVLPTQDADNGSLRVISDHPLYKVYEFDADWDNKQDSGNNPLSWLMDVLQFRGNQISNGAWAFYYTSAVELTALPDIDTSNLTDMERMFSNAKYFNQDISHFNVSNVENMQLMVSGASVFDQDIGGWDTSNVENMTSMFYMASVFNQDLSGWCVEKIDSAPYNFGGSVAFQGQTAKQPQWGAPC